MDALGAIDQFIADIDAAHTLEEIFTCLRRRLAQWGFERYAYELLWSAEGPQPSFYDTNYPSDWIEHYIRKRYVADDIVVLYTAQTVRPFLWQEVTRTPNLTTPQRRVFHEGQTAGIKAGASIPLHGPGAARAYLVVANDMSDDAFARLFMAHRHALQLIATYAHDRLLTLSSQHPPHTPVKFTPRAIEIMAWTARGKTSWDIAKILNLSQATVKEHIANVCHKLDVTNKTQATALLLLHGYIIL